MLVILRAWYRDGVLVRMPRDQPGQIISDRVGSVPVLHLQEVEWVHNTKWPRPPLCTLWQPVMVGIGHSNIVVRGFELIEKSGTRRWALQKWTCDVTTFQHARTYFGRLTGEIPSQIPRAPPPADPDRPFE